MIHDWQFKLCIELPIHPSRIPGLLFSFSFPFQLPLEVSLTFSLKALDPFGMSKSQTLK
ncbi:MAG: hypothetical protein JWQ71_351 [Pedosphaera sp.]|nr:hypothetical protein [Pedosphaera sp.]